MKTTGLIGLLLASVVAVLVAVLVSRGTGAPVADPQVAAPVLPEMSKRIGDVTRMTLVHGGDTTTLVRRGNAWGVEEKGGYSADSGKLRQALLGLADLRYVEPKTRKADLYPRLEVEDAGQKGAKSTLVTLSDDKNALLGEVIIGKRRIDELGGGTDGIYVRKPGDAQSWLARGTLDVADTTQGWLDRKIVDIAADKVKEMILTQPDGSTLDIVRDTPEGKLSLKGAPADTKLRSEEALVEPTTALADLDLADVRPADAMPFPKEGLARVEITTFSGLSVNIALLDKDGGHWARLEASGTGEAEKRAAELNAKFSRWVYGLSETKAKALQTKLSDLVGPPKPS